MKGLFITLEGPDGSGKSTQTRLLGNYLRDNGYDVVLTREPGGTPVAERIRQVLLDSSLSGMHFRTEVMLYAASRAQHVEELIKPALQEGKIVISDRFVDSSLAYQGYGRQAGFDLVWQVNRLAVGEIWPDLTILLDLDVTRGLNRIREKRLQLSERALDRMEREPVNFHKRVREGFLLLARQYPQRIKVISAAQTIEDVFGQVKGLVDELLLKANGCEINE